LEVENVPLHPDARAFLEKMAKCPQPSDIPLEEFRKAAGALVPTGPKAEIGSVKEVVVAGGDQQKLALRLYCPEGIGPFPVIVWVHPGSFVRGTLDMFDSEVRDFVKTSNCILVAVDYRLSPESTFPAALNDCYAALQWASTHASEFGGKTDVVGVAGESSGGNIAAATTLLARDRGGPRISFQVLFEPLLDAHCSVPSVDEFSEGYVLTKRQLIWMYEKYAPGVSLNDPLLSPLRAPDLRGLPPAVIVTIEYDPVRDDGEHYAQRLKAAGVPVLQSRIAGMVHHFPGSEAMPTLVRMLNDLFRSQSWHVA
jgi:acetyl esterase